MTDDEPRFNGAGDDLNEKHEAMRTLRAENERLVASLDAARGTAAELQRRHAEWLDNENAELQALRTVNGDVHRIIKRMQDECAELGACTDDMPCQACMQLARLEGELRGRLERGPVYSEATVSLLRELRAMAEEGALYEIRKRIRKALDSTDLPVVPLQLRDELREVLTLPWDARIYQYQRAITRALDILEADGTKKGT